MDLYSFLEPLSKRMEEYFALVELALEEGSEVDATKLMTEVKKIDNARKEVLNAMRQKFGEKSLSNDTKRILETMGKEPDVKLDYNAELERAGLDMRASDHVAYKDELNYAEANNMFNKLLKLANELDEAGHYEEANAVDDVLKSLAMGEDVVQQPMPLEQPVSELDKMKMELELLKKQNEELMAKQRAKPSGSMKVSEKGGVSVYGIGRFPVTLYKSQWERLLARKEDILKFIADNAALLKVKEE